MLGILKNYPIFNKDFWVTGAHSYQLGFDYLI